MTYSPLKHWGVKAGDVVGVGALEPMKPLNNMQIAMMRKSTSGSLIGSIAETQEVLAFCGAHGVAPMAAILRMAAAAEGSLEG